jgi:putative DNA primase/helicase
MALEVCSRAWTGSPSALTLLWSFARAKSADAAARVFPENVCITSPGGSKAWKQADWSPLAGRKVLVWPDCDETGEEYGREVARIIHGLGCEVSIIDAVALASLAPAGGQQEPEK